nr:hypothetical protein [Candidatus Sigynarchaeota archaeon]
MVPKKPAPGLDGAAIDMFSCDQPITPATIQQVANLFLPGRLEIHVTESLVDLIKVYKIEGRDLCWLYRLLKEAAPYVDAIDQEWCAIFNDPEFLVKNPGNEYLLLEDDSNRRIKETCAQGELFILLPRIFDDEGYKCTLLQSIRLNFETEFINTWRQRVGKWVIPLRPKGKPGPFYRDDGKWLSTV